MRKNPIAVAARSYSAWRRLRGYPGVFSIPDACLQLRQLLQLDRITEWELRRFVDKELDIKQQPGDVQEVTVKGNGLKFYWLGPISGGLASGVLQELDPGHPHYYTTRPIRMTPASVVLDVGACDGLFAFRVLKSREASKVVCFEPSARTASFLEKAASLNGVGDRIRVEVSAVGLQSGEVFFTDFESPEGNRVVTAGAEAARKVKQVSLDDYCRENGLKLGPKDLIKVDAEGSDVDVIKGAEQQIRQGAPQIAVTTYHDPGHAEELIRFLGSVQPKYQLRLKGFTMWNTKNYPRPVLLQAACAGGE
jgi:FkbM family methyltransferase